MLESKHSGDNISKTLEMVIMFSCDRCNKIYCNDRIGSSTRYPTDSVLCKDCLDDIENEPMD